VTPDPASPIGARLDAAAAIGVRYAAEPAVDAVLCGGSTGRGHADRWSDLEIGVFWSRPPEERLRRAVVADLGGADLRAFDYDADDRCWFDEFWYSGAAGAGLLVEVVHMTAADADALLDRLLTATDVRGGLLAFAAAIVYGRPLAGSVERYVSRLRAYPRPVATAVVRRHGQIDHFWRWQMYVERGDVHGLRAHFAAVATALTHMVCALNGRWWPGGKWPRLVTAGLPIAPERLTTRLAAVDALAPPEAAAALSELVEETYDLVAEHLPEADPERLRTIFRFARTPWPATRCND